MKYSLLTFALFSTTVFAIGTNELTGSFELAPVGIVTHTDSGYLMGATISDDPQKTREPSSLSDEKEGEPHVTELTGTFE